MLDIASLYTQLLAPLDRDNPCGEDMSFSSEFDSIQQSRIEEDHSLDQGAWVTERKTANWPFIEKQCIDLLTTRAKDLRLGLWYTEAITHTQGFEGFALGLDLLNGLITTYWQNLHPVAEDGDQEARISLLNWFVQQSNRLLRQTPLTHSAKHTLNYNDLESAHQLKASIESNSDFHNEPAPDKITLEQYTESQNATPIQTLQQSFQSLIKAQDTWTVFTTTLDEHLGLDAPAFGTINKTFDLIHDHLDRTLRDHGGIPSRITQIESVGTTPHNNASPSMTFNPNSNGHIQNRQQAMQVLQQISEYFVTYEPHSPVSYMLKKTIRWANMPLHEWLAHVVKDNNPLDSLNELLGINPAHQNE
ncbi:MAG: type VI secretion system protein TssA [Gammaproteobacteria bacterium]|nr:type VI secretion system protein TssA [Gammaproteobacteria bacterium]